MEKTYLYIIGNSKGFIKVGLSKNPQKRVKQLQTGNGEQLTLIFTEEFECPRKNVFKIEKMVHKELKRLCTKKEGEWFCVEMENIIQIQHIITWHRIRYENVISLNSFN